MTSAPSPAPTVLAGVLETAAADPSIRPQDDLFRHVNGVADDFFNTNLTYVDLTTDMPNEIN